MRCPTGAAARAASISFFLARRRRESATCAAAARSQTAAIRGASSLANCARRMPSTAWPSFNVAMPRRSAAEMRRQRPAANLTAAFFKRFFTAPSRWRMFASLGRFPLHRSSFFASISAARHAASRSAPAGASSAAATCCCTAGL